MRRVTNGRTYRYVPASWDRVDPPYGEHLRLFTAGDIVRAISLPGCPPANTMGHCHIETLDGQFAGLVCCASLESVKGGR